MKQQAKNVFCAVMGAVLMLTGAWLLYRNGTGTVLPYVCIGLGSGALGYGVGEWLRLLVLHRCPEQYRELEIEQQDERNIALANRAKARAYDGMLYLFSALMLIFVLMDVELTAVLLLVGAYLCVVGLQVYYLYRYSKEM
ncbi:MAG: hypothetical protein ACOX7F_02195 [Eubacteriales bacterium]|jgi:hypothetical protein